MAQDFAITDPKAFDRLSDAEKYKMRGAIIYGKNARPKDYKRALAVAQGHGGEQTKTAPKKKKATRKIVGTKTTMR
jgi:hypothetical protein